MKGTAKTSAGKSAAAQESMPRSIVDDVFGMTVMQRTQCLSGAPAERTRHSRSFQVSSQSYVLVACLHLCCFSLPSEHEHDCVMILSHAVLVCISFRWSYSIRQPLSGHQYLALLLLLTVRRPAKARHPQRGPPLLTS